MAYGMSVSTRDWVKNLSSSLPLVLPDRATRENFAVHWTNVLSIDLRSKFFEMERAFVHPEHAEAFQGGIGEVQIRLKILDGLTSKLREDPGGFHQRDADEMLRHIDYLRDVAPPEPTLFAFSSHAVLVVQSLNLWVGRKDREGGASGNVA